MSDADRLSLPLSGGPGDGRAVVVRVPRGIGNALIAAHVGRAWFAGRPAFDRGLTFCGYEPPATGIVVEVLAVTPMAEDDE